MEVDINSAFKCPPLISTHDKSRLNASRQPHSKLMLAALLNLEYQQLSQLCRSARYFRKVFMKCVFTGVVIQCWVLIVLWCYLAILEHYAVSTNVSSKLESVYIQYIDCNNGFLLLDSGIGLTNPKHLAACRIYI